MIFTNQERENGPDIQFIGDYQVYWINKAQRKKNLKWDAFSGYILDVKESRVTALLYFVQRIDPLLAKDIAICAVPSHDCQKTYSGIRTIGQRLALAGRVDATGCLVRERSVDKAAHGGERSVEVHLSSISVHDSELIRDKEILLLDDVTTTGSSLIACQQLLLKAGARRVKCLALAKTARHE